MNLQENPSTRIGEPVISIRNLDFGFRQPLFTGLDLDIPKGACFGLLGPNGAGKSTLMQLMVGLRHFSSGSIQLLGQDMPNPGSLAYRHIGLLLEDPRLYPRLTGRENLQTFARYRSLSESRIEEVLQLTGMATRAGLQVRHCSTGMKQRLGIALAMLHDPEVLLLDEPTNGLDPAGIAEVRELIATQRDKHTVIVSSHLLSEVEQICTHLAVMDKGRLRFVGRTDEFRRQFQGKGLHLRLQTAPGHAWPLPKVPATSAGADWYQIYLEQRSDIPDLLRSLDREGFPVFQAIVQDDKLETAYLKLLDQKPGP